MKILLQINLQTFEISIWRYPKQAGAVFLLLRTVYLTKLIERDKRLIKLTERLVDKVLYIILTPSLVKHTVRKSLEKNTELLLNNQKVEK